MLLLPLAPGRNDVCTISAHTFTIDSACNCVAQESVAEAQRIMNEACKAADPDGAIFAASTAAWAIYAFLKTPSDFWRTIFACIEVGGKQRPWEALLR